MNNKTVLPNRPDRSCFVDGRAICDIFDFYGVKWIAKGQKVTEKQITVALKKGSTTKIDFKANNLVKQRSTKSELKPTFDDIVKITNQIEQAELKITADLASGIHFSASTQQEIKKSTAAISNLIQSNQFSPYKLNGLTTFLYNDKNFKHKRSILKTLNSSGIQYMLFKDIIEDNIDDFITANILNPFERIDQKYANKASAEMSLSAEEYSNVAREVSDELLNANSGGNSKGGFLTDLIKYFAPHLYFTSPEARLFQQINSYINFAMPCQVKEQLNFKPSLLPSINLANYYQARGSGLGVEGTRIVQYVGLIPSGTAIQFTNREKGVITAPKENDTLYCVVITGMDGQPLASPSLKEVQVKQLNKDFKIIPSSDLPLKYDEHAHEKIWKMHIVRENLRRWHEKGTN